jgi:CheY-like chemotaxis protein
MNRADTRILIVDDDPFLLAILGDTLGSIGYQVTRAESGTRALELLQEFPFELMITDVKMPDIDGLQLFRQVREKYAGLPVLFITGVASEEIMGTVDADGFLSKPFRIAQIEKLISETLARRI